MAKTNKVQDQYRLRKMSKVLRERPDNGDRSKVIDFYSAETAKTIIGVPLSKEAYHTLGYKYCDIEYRHSARYRREWIKLQNAERRNKKHSENNRVRNEIRKVIREAD